MLSPVSESIVRESASGTLVIGEVPNWTTMLLNVVFEVAPATFKVNVTVPPINGLCDFVFSEPFAFVYDFDEVPPMTVLAGPAGAFVPAQITQTPNAPTPLLATIQPVGLLVTTFVGCPLTRVIANPARLDENTAVPTGTLLVDALKYNPLMFWAILMTWLLVSRLVSVIVIVPFPDVIEPLTF